MISWNGGFSLILMKLKGNFIDFKMIPEKKLPSLKLTAKSPENLMVGIRISFWGPASVFLPYRGMVKDLMFLRESPFFGRGWRGRMGYSKWDMDIPNRASQLRTGAVSFLRVLQFTHSRPCELANLILWARWSSTPTISMLFMLNARR